jgi:hypothetical protein
MGFAVSNSGCSNPVNELRQCFAALPSLSLSLSLSLSPPDGEWTPLKVVVVKQEGNVTLKDPHKHRVLLNVWHTRAPSMSRVSFELCHTHPVWFHHIPASNTKVIRIFMDCKVKCIQNLYGFLCVQRYFLFEKVFNRSFARSLGCCDSASSGFCLVTERNLPEVRVNMSRCLIKLRAMKMRVKKKYKFHKFATL